MKSNSSPSVVVVHCRRLSGLFVGNPSPPLSLSLSLVCLCVFKNQESCVGLTDSWVMEVGLCWLRKCDGRCS